LIIIAIAAILMIIGMKVFQRIRARRRSNVSTFQPVPTSSAPAHESPSFSISHQDDDYNNDEKAHII